MILCAFGANTGQNKAKYGAILKFKMAAEDTLEKNGSNSAFVHWSIKKVKSIGSTSIANFALDYITPCTKISDQRKWWKSRIILMPTVVRDFTWMCFRLQIKSARKLISALCCGLTARALFCLNSLAKVSTQLLIYNYWLISIIMASSYRETRYSRPLLSHWSINQFCLVYIFSPSYAPFISLINQNGSFLKTHRPLPHLHIIQICPHLPLKNALTTPLYITD